MTWKREIAASLALHALLALSIVAISWARIRSGNNWGSDQAGFGAMSATLVSSAIPLPAHEKTENIVANESKSVAQPHPPVPEPKPTRARDESALDIPDKTAVAKPTKPAPAYKAPAAPPNTAAYADPGRVNIPMAAIATGAGAGAVAISGGGDFANRYAWYVQAVQRKVQQQWLAYEADPRAAQGRRVYLSFSIRRDGTPTEVKVEQPSGVASLDYSALNAMRRIDTFGPLPSDYRGSSVSVQFYFDYKR